MTTYEECLKIATEAHKGQKRFNGVDYITHPIVVANNFDNIKLKCIAILHNILEDTKITSLDLFEKGISPEIVDVVKLLSRSKEQSYKDFILNILWNEDAIKVKIADIKHNLSDLKSGSLRDKYELALYILGNDKIN